MSRYVPFRTEIRSLPGAMRTTGPEESPDVFARIEDWCTSADERLVLTVIGRARAELRAAGLDRRLFNAAVARADEEGVLWSPVLDRIATAGLWPAAGVRRGMIETYTESAHRRVAQLGQWVRNEGTEEDVLKIASAFNAPALLRQVARDAPILSARVIQALIEAHAPTAAYMARNPALNASSARALVRHAVAGFRDASPPERAEAVLGDVLKELGARRVEMDQELIEWLTAFLRRDGDRGAKLPLARIARILPLLGTYPYVSEECLIQYYAMLVPTPPASAAMIRHVARAPIEFFRSIARTSIYAQVHEALALREPARSDASVRGDVINWGAPRAMCALLPDASRQEFRRILERMIEKGVEVTKEWLRSEGLPGHLRLEPVDIEPLLEHDDAELRLLAITALSDLRPGRNEPPRERRNP